MTRARLGFFVAAALALGLLGPSAVAGSSSDGSLALGHTVRWDLVQIVQRTALAGGADTAKDRGTDAFAGDTVTLTGSGDAEPGERDATGGGTFVHRHSDGTEVAHGIWFVTGFESWEPLGGTLPIRDAIGHNDETTAGVLVLDVHLVSSGGVEHDAVLTIDCHLPGAREEVTEGVVLMLGSTTFTQDGGVTLFHVLR